MLRNYETLLLQFVKSCFGKCGVDLFCMNKMKHISVGFLSAMIVLQSVSLLLVDAGYNVNHSYIASALCVNRNKPQMHCDGKCFLKKELNNQQEKESSQRTIHPNSSITFFCEEISSYHFYHTDRKFFFPNKNSCYSSGFLTNNERPPAC